MRPERHQLSASVWSIADCRERVSVSTSESFCRASACSACNWAIRLTCHRYSRQEFHSPCSALGHRPANCTSRRSRSGITTRAATSWLPSSVLSLSSVRAASCANANSRRSGSGLVARRFCRPFLKRLAVGAHRFVARTKLGERAAQADIVGCFPLQRPQHGADGLEEVAEGIFDIVERSDPTAGVGQQVPHSRIVGADAGASSASVGSLHASASPEYGLTASGRKSCGDGCMPLRARKPGIVRTVQKPNVIKCVAARIVAIPCPKSKELLHCSAFDRWPAVTPRFANP